ncbi:hypothetical protein VTL71DRAFT_164 [Oculimacula yallundae]
MKYYYYL